MSITVNRKNREIRTQGVVSFDVAGADVGKTYDFMGIAKGFRIVDVNITVDEAFENADNTIEVGIEGATNKFIAATAVNAIKGVPFNNKQYTAPQVMSIITDIKGTASATGKATITVTYAKLADSRQEY
jgi:hypothetical protein